ncbi:MAG: ribonuclease HII [Candidatus Paceibacterota bacterium]
MERFIVGIDEVGRGPLAGPLTVGIVGLPKGFKKKELPLVRDSKKLSPEKRNEIVRAARKLKKEKKLFYTTVSISEKEIDRRGISKCLSLCIKKGLLRLPYVPSCVLLDGGLKAPEGYVQKTIIKGDSSEFAIGLASVIAKVKRDSYMEKMALRFPEYYFEKHKGYGTLEHRKFLKKYGPCDLHRKTFLHS